jgi:hypothetical protein
VILVDANLLIYARVASFQEHDRARSWLDDKLNGVPGVGLPWPSLLAFARLVSNPRVFERPVAIAEAWKQVEEWLDSPVAWTPAPTEHHREVVTGLIPHVGNRPNLIPDAHLAAIAIEHGLTLCSTDADFARFPGLRWENPIAA